ncbi:Era-like GTP-binding protein [Prochlorococcus sp. MIT 9123]|uniref:Era-like GTP-binding protein n=1 Tax=Prochlorococcus sp. MIT 9123 TaxID=3082523 RepID=UPI0039B484B6
MSDKKLFKKVVYKLFYSNKISSLSFKNTYGAAKTSLDSIEKINRKISDKVKVELLNYEKNKLERQLKTGDYKVTLFGAGSSGKTSIARSLLKNIVGKTSAKIGTTKQINSYVIRIPILKRNINIIDTPGLFEPSRIGEEREKSTILQASNSDLVLFVLDQDINKYEKYLINELLKIGKKIIIVLNKCDLRTLEDNTLIKENIISITSAKKNKISVVQTIAVPQKSSYIKSDPLNYSTDVGSLFREIIETLESNGEELLAENILFSSSKLGIKSKKFIQEQRYLMSNKVIKKYMWITGGSYLLIHYLLLIFLLPLQ